MLDETRAKVADAVSVALDFTNKKQSQEALKLLSSQ